VGGQRREGRLSIGPSGAPTDWWEVESHDGGARYRRRAELVLSLSVKIRSIEVDIGAGDAEIRRLVCRGLREQRLEARRQTWLLFSGQQRAGSARVSARLKMFSAWV